MNRSIRGMALTVGLAGALLALGATALGARHADRPTHAAGALELSGVAASSLSLFA